MLLKLSKIFLHVSLLSIVVVLTSAFFPFIGGKDYFFRFAVELALIFYILSWAFEPQGRELWHRMKEVGRKPLFIAVSVFVFVVLLSSLFAFDPHAAFWSNYERGEGMFQVLHYYVFFALLVVLFKKREDWRSFFKTFLVAAVCMILYGVFADSGWASGFISQYQGAPEPGLAWFKPLANRFQGSLGNPAYVAPYLMFSLFFTLYLLVTGSSEGGRDDRGDLFEKWMYFAIGTLAFLWVASGVDFLRALFGGGLAEFYGNVPGAHSQAFGILVVAALYFLLLRYLFFKEQKVGANKIVRRIVFGVLAAFFFLFFMVTQTRGAFVGILMAAYVFLVFVGFMLPKRRLQLLGGIAAFLVGTSILVHFKSNALLQLIPGGRMFDLPLSTPLLTLVTVGGLIAAALAMFARERKFLWWVLGGLAVAGLIGGTYAIGTGRINLVDPTTSTRFWTWGSAWQGIKERPVLGWGLENFTPVFDKYFDPRHFIPGQSTETWFDRAHSIYFDYLVETGVLGFAAYLGIFVLLYVGLFGKKILYEKGISTVEKALLAVLPIGYLVQGVAIFDVLPICVNVFAMFAFGYYFLYAHHGEHEAGAVRHTQ